MGSPNLETGRSQVVEGCPLPGDFGMAGLAVGRETQAVVVRIVDRREIAFVTTETQIRCSGIILRMASDTINAQVGPPDLEFAGVLESGISPARGYSRMACLAVSGETGLCMIRITGGGEIVLMAAFAIQGSAGELLAALFEVAGLAIDYGVNSHKREAPRSMPFEQILTVLPGMRRMAILTFYAELASMDVGVTIGTFHTDIREFQILVAAKALYSLVVSDKGEAGGGMIELQRLPESIPGARGMTDPAIPLEIAVGTRHRFLASDRHKNRKHGDRNRDKKI